MFNISLLSITSLLYLGPPSTPVVALSQTDNSCSNIKICWPTPSSDRSITSYSVYRNNTLIYNGTDNQCTDNTQLNINTVYEYSVVAISCAGNSTAGVMSVTGGEIILTHRVSSRRAARAWRRINLEDKSSRRAKIESAPIDVVQNMLSRRVWMCSSSI